MVVSLARGQRMQFGQLKRREFIILLGGAAIVRPRTALAQQPAIPVIGFLNSRASGEDATLLASFHRGLRDAGYVEGQNLTVEYRWASGQYDRLPALAADLVDRRVAVIVANGPASRPAKTASSTLPIVFVVGFDPLAFGLVASLSRPGGNLTGVSVLDVELGAKRIELLHELIPKATTFGLLVNPTTPAAEAVARDAQAAARVLGLQLHILHASSDRELDTAFAALAQLRPSALTIGADPFFTSRSKQLAELALVHAMPTIYEFREFAAAGGLISYGTSITDAYRLAGVYTGRTLKGEKPSDLPVQQATKVELIINLKTAKMLGITFPLTLLGRADEVIE